MQFRGVTVLIVDYDVKGVPNLITFASAAVTGRRKSKVGENLLSRWSVKLTNKIKKGLSAKSHLVRFKVAEVWTKNVLHY